MPFLCIVFTGRELRGGCRKYGYVGQGVAFDVADDPKLFGQLGGDRLDAVGGFPVFSFVDDAGSLLAEGCVCVVKLRVGRRRAFVYFGYEDVDDRGRGVVGVLAGAGIEDVYQLVVGIELESFE